MKVKQNSRRGLIKVAVTSSGIFALSTQIPSRWSTPLIDAVLLPAHAQTSTILDAVAEPPSGNEVPLNQNISLSVSPGVGVTVDIDITCNGAPSNSGSFSLPTDAAGNLTIIGNGSGEGCVVGDVLGISVTANGETASPTWVMIA